METNMVPLNKILNTIAAKLPILDPSDLAPLSEIVTEFESVKQKYKLPAAFSVLIDRAISLIGNIIMAETPFTEGCKKLYECVAKMMKEADKYEKKTENSKKNQSDRINRDQEKPVAFQIPEDLKDIVLKFASGQQAVLEDFEAYILELEKGNPDAKDAIKRILHTWKGEFGVLDMPEYSGLIHEIEEGFENGRIAAENLFMLKDFLLERMGDFAAGVCPKIGEDERLALTAGAKAGTAPVKNDGRAGGDRQAKSRTENAAQSPDNTPSKTSERPFHGDTSLLTDFINESRDHLHTAETFLLELETDPARTEHVDSIFRAWHTIKGTAGFLSLSEIQELAHAMESVMDRVRKREIGLGAACIDILLEGNDCLKTFLTHVEEALSTGVLKIPPQHDALMQRLRACHAQESGISGPALPTSEKRLGEILVESGAAKPADVAAAIEKQMQGDSRKLGEILIDEAKLPARAVGGALAAQSAARAAHGVEETIRVPVSRIGTLVDTIGEAVIAQSMIYAHPSIRSIDDQTLHTKIAHASMIMRQIQEMAMSLRMVSVKATFQKMARLARDLAKKFGKELDFVTEGEGTELDKSVVENIGDPLIHMIRNAIDHGVEPADERIKAGKPARARVALRAYHRAGNIYIEVSDDGRGLDAAAIREKAISRGLCKPDERLSDEEIFRFIFLPGFSTAKVVTDVSGRGVGMDVVRRNIEALRGSVEIASKPGKGTTFTIRLPLTLAIVDGMIVRAGGESYIVPTLAIIESLKPSPEQIDTVMRKGAFVKVRGELIPLVHLAALFSKNGKNGNGNVDYLQGVVMIVEDMLGKKIGLHLDEIVGQQQVVIKSLGEGVGDVSGVTGGAIMSDGTVSLILDIGGIVKLAQSV